jgi:hypothetical protein
MQVGRDFLTPCVRWYPWKFLSKFSTKIFKSPAQNKSCCLDFVLEIGLTSVRQRWIIGDIWVRPDHCPSQGYITTTLRNLLILIWLTTADIRIINLVNNYSNVFVVILVDNKKVWKSGTLDKQVDLQWDIGITLRVSLIRITLIFISDLSYLL